MWCRVNSFHENYKYKNGHCPMPLGPICGENRITYRDICAFMEAKSHIPYLKVLHYEACGTGSVVSGDRFKITKGPYTTQKLQLEFIDETV